MSEFYGVDIAQGLKIAGGNAMIYTRLLGKFLQNTLYSELVESVENGDAALFTDKSHAFKGVCANLHFEELYELMKELDAMAKEQTLPAPDGEEMMKLKSAFENTLASVKMISEHPDVLDKYK